MPSPPMLRGRLPRRAAARHDRSPEWPARLSRPSPFPAPSSTSRKESLAHRAAPTPVRVARRAFLKGLDCVARRYGRSAMSAVSHLRLLGLVVWVGIYVLL